MRFPWPVEVFLWDDHLPKYKVCNISVCNDYITAAHAMYSTWGASHPILCLEQRGPNVSLVLGKGWLWARGWRCELLLRNLRLSCREFDHLVSQCFATLCVCVCFQVPQDHLSVVVSEIVFDLSHVVHMCCLICVFTSSASTSAVWTRALQGSWIKCPSPRRSWVLSVYPGFKFFFIMHSIQSRAELILGVCLDGCDGLLAWRLGSFVARTFIHIPVGGSAPKRYVSSCPALSLLTYYIGGFCG